MGLRLSVISYHRFTAGIEQVKTLAGTATNAELIIGRSEQCAWYLPDPDRVISSRHARITYENGQFYLHDTSTNGTFINRAVEAMPKDQPYCLSDGDIVAFGDYEIEVRIDDAAPVTVLSEQTAPKPVAHTAQGGHEENFGLPLAETTLCETPTQEDEAAPRLDSCLNSNLDDAFALGNDTADTAIPEDWHALFTPSVSAAPKENTRAVKPSVATPVHNVSHDDVAHAPQHVELAHSNKKPHGDVKATVGCHSQINTNSTNSHAQDSAVCLNAFLQGMGVTGELLSQTHSQQWWQQLGVITRDALDGLMNTLHNRTAFKESSRINQTTFQRSENNPLKFSSNVEDALHNLLQRRSAGFLPPERAVKEAFIDLERHEIAMMAGTEGAIESLMKLLSPQTIEQRDVGVGALVKYPSVLSKQRNWKRYCALHAELSQDLTVQDRAFYRDDFAKAYETRIKEMEQKGK